VIKLKSIGSVLIITGTAIGAGMLAIPIVTAALGFWGAVVLLFACWALMTYTALLVLETNLFFGVGSSFHSMAKYTLGKKGQFLTWISFLLLLYALDAAYMSGGSSLLDTAFYLIEGEHLQPWVNTLIFTGVLGGVVVWGMHAVDRFNRFLMFLKALTFLLLLILVMPHVHMHLLAQNPVSRNAWWLAIPILITSFGFHIVIPSVQDYIGNFPERLRKIVLIGSTIPLIVYLLWVFATLGVIPRHGPNSFTSIEHNDVGDMVLVLRGLLHSSWVSFFVNCFTDIAVTTSFLGVSISLFDFMADGFKLNKKKVVDRGIITLLTFVIPLLFALFYPHGFVMALGYASIFVAILLIILPALMVRSLRKLYPLSYSVVGGSFALWIVMLLGVGVIITEFWH